MSVSSVTSAAMSHWLSRVLSPGVSRMHLHAAASVGAFDKSPGSAGHRGISNRGEVLPRRPIAIPPKLNGTTEPNGSAQPDDGVRAAET